MKTAIVFADGIKQINLTAENDAEKLALKLITPSDNLSLAVVSSTFGPIHGPQPYSVNIQETVGHYLRAFETNETSVMLVLRPKTEPIPNSPLQTYRTPKEIAEDFTERALKTVNLLTGEDYNIGFKEGIEKYLESLA